MWHAFINKFSVKTVRKFLTLASRNRPCPQSNHFDCLAMSSLAFFFAYFKVLFWILSICSIILHTASVTALCLEILVVPSHKCSLIKWCSVETLQYHWSKQITSKPEKNDSISAYFVQSSTYIIKQAQTYSEILSKLIRI